MSRAEPIEEGIVLCKRRLLPSRSGGDLAIAYDDVAFAHVVGKPPCVSFNGTANRPDTHGSYMRTDDKKYGKQVYAKV